MTTNTRTRRPSVAARRAGYVIAAVLNAVLWYLLNIRPGWRVLPFLTEDMSSVLPVVNVSLVAGLVANVLYLVYDAPWWKSLGDLFTMGISLAVLVRVGQVFPFAFSGSSAWSWLVRIVLVLAMAGTAIAIVVSVVSLIRSTLHGAARVGSGHHLPG